MKTRSVGVLALTMTFVLHLSGCNSSGTSNTNSTAGGGDRNTNSTAAANTTSTPAQPDEDGVISSGTGTAKESPPAGKANVQGKVFYNNKPAENIEVKLCEKFNRFFGGCGGETFTARTDAAGEYLIKGVTPRLYEGLTAKVFDTDFYVFATSGIVQTAKYKVEDGETFFAPDTHLFKQDLKIQSPKAGSKIGGSDIELKWAEYPDAAYYKFNIQADSASGAKTEYDYINKRVEGTTSYKLDKPLTPGTYTARVEAYNGDDRRLAKSADDIKFTVTGGGGAAQ